MDIKNYYKTLGVPTNAPMDHIRSAFKRRAMELHPDKNPSETAVQEFQRLNEAYSVLSNPEKRERYDAGFDEEEDMISADFSNFADFFQMFFGGGFAYEVDDDDDYYYDSDDYDSDNQFGPDQYFNGYFQYDEADESPFFFIPNQPKVPVHLRYYPNVHIGDKIMVDWSKWKLPFSPILNYKLKAINADSRIEYSLYKGKKTKVNVTGLEPKEKYYFIVTASLDESEKISSLPSKTIFIPDTKKQKNKHNNKSTNNKQKNTEDSKPNQGNTNTGNKKKDNGSKNKSNQPQTNGSKTQRGKNQSKSTPTESHNVQKNDDVDTSQPVETTPSTEQETEPTEQQQPEPNTRQRTSKTRKQQPPQQQQQQKSSNICRFYQQGKCRKGNACPFIHQTK
jgi:curved DNA-binding protein CbpA